PHVPASPCYLASAGTVKSPPPAPDLSLTACHTRRRMGFTRSRPWAAPVQHARGCLARSAVPFPVNAMLRVQVNNEIGCQELEHPGGPLEFGRGPKRGDVPRCVLRDVRVSRDHARVEELPEGKLRVENLSQRHPIALAGKPAIAPGERRDLSVPVRLVLGDSHVRIEQALPEPVDRASLQTVTEPPPLLPTVSARLNLLQLGDAPAPQTLTHWFETLIAVQQAAAGSPEFYEQTARALVELIGLDRGLVL